MSSLLSYAKTGQQKCVTGHLKLKYEFNKFVCAPTVQIINSPFQNVMALTMLLLHAKEFMFEPNIKCP